MNKETSIYLGILSGIGTYLMPIYILEWTVRSFTGLFIGNTEIKLIIANIVAFALVIIFTISTVTKLKENKIFIKTYLATIIFSIIMYILRISLIVF